MLFPRIALLAIVPLFGISSAPATADSNDPALVWARHKCLTVFPDKGFQTYQDCVAFYYAHYPIDPFDP